jgi:putative membrane protein
VPVIAQLFAVVAALIHIWFFVMESVLWRRPSVWARFRIGSQADAATIAPMALNQGFYNLFLALGVLGGVWLARTSGDGAVGQAVALFACACMAGAGVVLVLSDRRFLPAALIQAVPPALAILTAVVFAVGGTVTDLPGTAV